MAFQEVDIDMSAQASSSKGSPEIQLPREPERKFVAKVRRMSAQERAERLDSLAQLAQARHMWEEASELSELRRAYVRGRLEEHRRLAEELEEHRRLVEELEEHRRLVEELEEHRRRLAEELERTSGRGRWLPKYRKDPSGKERPLEGGYFTFLVKKAMTPRPLKRAAGTGRLSSFSTGVWSVLDLTGQQWLGIADDFERRHGITVALAWQCVGEAMAEAVDAIAKDEEIVRSSSEQESSTANG